ncbi:MAG TPA: hypothetical protein VIH50_04310 [Steroidobacteraceae bacterium]
MTPAATRAGELDLTGGIEQSTPDFGHSYSWGAEYRQPLTMHFAASLIWLNEGHLVNHHRDGQALQFWWRSATEGPGLVFEAGVGPYHYYDTTDAIDVSTPHGIVLDYEDAHGWGVLASAAVDWYFKHGWFTTVRLNDIEAAGEVRSTALTLGVGYRFGEEEVSGFRWTDSWFAAPPPRLEVDALAGQVVLNSFHSEAAVAEALSMRAKISTHFAASVTYTIAPDAPLDWHSGAAVQLWAETEVTHGFSIGAGVGAFFTAVRANATNTSPSSNPEGIVGVTLAYRLSSRWVARAIWDRITTRDDNDSDIVLVGFGYQF